MVFFLELLQQWLANDGYFSGPLCLPENKFSNVFVPKWYKIFIFQQIFNLKIN
jgi:hypothetical protein